MKNENQEVFSMMEEIADIIISAAYKIVEVDQKAKQKAQEELLPDDFEKKIPGAKKIREIHIDKVKREKSPGGYSSVVFKSHLNTGQIIERKPYYFTPAAVGHILNDLLKSIGAKGLTKYSDPREYEKFPYEKLEGKDMKAEIHYGKDGKYHLDKFLGFIN